MRHDDEFVLARARFFAKVDAMVSAVSCGGPPPASAGGFLHTEEVEEPAASGPVELMGDWSWRPENQPRDAGIVLTGNPIPHLVWDTVMRRLVIKETGGPLPGLRPWMIEPYDGHDLVEKPKRIGPNI